MLLDLGLRVVAIDCIGYGRSVSEALDVSFQIV